MFLHFSVNDQVQQMNTINAMNTFEQGLKLLARQTGGSSNLTQAQPSAVVSAQSTLQNQLTMETMLQNEALSSLLQQQSNLQQVSSTPGTSNEASASLTQLLQLSHNSSSTNDLLQGTMFNIFGLPASSSSALPTTSSPTNSEVLAFLVMNQLLNDHKLTLD